MADLIIMSAKDTINDVVDKIKSLGFDVKVVKWGLIWRI